MRASRVAWGLALVAVAACAAPARTVAASGSAAPAAVVPTASPSAPAAEVVADTAPLLTQVSRGGRCVYGECLATLTVRRDGAFTSVVGRDAPRTGHVSRASVDALAAAVRDADFTRIRAVKFTGTCPTAYDGTEQVYTFHTAPGAPEIASCQVAIDPRSALFVAVEAVVSQTRD